MKEKTHLSLPTEMYALQANVLVPWNICIYEDIVMNDTFFFSSWNFQHKRTLNSYFEIHCAIFILPVF